MGATHRVFIVLGLVSGLSACTPVPSDETLEADIQSVIDSGLAPGLIEVDRASHAGAWPFVWGDPARVGFDASLRLKRDHRFGAWDQVNAGTLALLLDTAPGGLGGVTPAGNAAGDIILVHGYLPYSDTGSGAKLSTIALTPTPEHGFVLVSDFERSLNARWLRAMAELRASRLGISLEEWSRARRAISGRAARMNGGFSVATDAENSVYWKIGEAAERGAREQGVAFANVPVNGASEALDFLRAGRVSAAIVRNTEAVLAINSLPPYESAGPYRLWALAALYPLPIHIVVKESSPLGSPAELFGKHVGVAGQAQVDTGEAEAILRSHGVPLASLAAPLVSVPVAQAFDQLEAGAFDALVMTAGLPSPELYRFAAQRPVRLLPFDGDAIAFLTAGIANYVAITIPARTYPGQARPLAAVAAVAMLVSTDTVPEKEAAGLTDLMLTRIEYLRGGSLEGAMISRSDALRPMTLPWHPGVAQAFGSIAKN